MKPTGVWKLQSTRRVCVNLESLDRQDLLATVKFNARQVLRIVRVGALLEQTGDVPAALAEQRIFQELMRALAAEHPEVPNYRRELAVSHNMVGALLEKTGDLAGELAEQRKGQELCRALAAEHPEVIDYRRDLF
jgi:hypothetical protein